MAAMLSYGSGLRVVAEGTRAGWCHSPMASMLSVGRGKGTGWWNCGCGRVYHSAEWRTVAVDGRGLPFCGRDGVMNKRV